MQIQPGEMTNFQVPGPLSNWISEHCSVVAKKYSSLVLSPLLQMASCTLDASVKIYSCRVDSIHSEAYKVLGGIGGQEVLPEGMEDGEDGEGAAEGDGADGEEGGKAKPKRRVS